MADYFIPKKNTAFVFFTSLVSQGTSGVFQANPTLATGDVTVTIDGAAAANLTTLPTVTPASGKRVKVSLSAAEMNGDNITVVFSDAAGSEWMDQTINIVTAAHALADITAKTDLITSGNVTITSAVNEAGDVITIYQGDDYKLTDSAAFTFTSTGFPTLTGATVLLKFATLELTGTVTSATSVYFEMTKTQTAAIAATGYKFEVQATLSNGSVRTIVTGDVNVTAQL